VPSLRAGLKLSARSYSQAGEDMLVRLALSQLGVARPSYLDIGAHHPTWLSNTFYFYRRRSKGVLVEPDPTAIRKLKLRRSRDRVLNVAVAGEDGRRTLHMFKGGRFNLAKINTLSDDDAADLRRQGWTYVKAITVPVLSPTTLLERHCDGTPDLVSIDVEGVDIEILRAWDFERFRPAVVVVETLTYVESGWGEKRPEVNELMRAVGYREFADTHVNTVFVDRR
jgi:FkbM family methyltransferase